MRTPDDGRTAQDRHPTKATPLLLSPYQAAAYLGVASLKWLDLCQKGLIPPPVRLDGSPFWGREELEEWAYNGCPPADAWATVWAAIRDARYAGSSPERPLHVRHRPSAPPKMPDHLL